jgi:Fur family peroxide stress response transcriptional regulator
MRQGTQILKQRGIRITPQRLGVYKILRDKATHLTAEDIYLQLKRSFPAISLATVYTILELFKGKNLVQEIRIHFGKSSFELEVHLHHHFLCNKCGKIFDIDIAPCATLKNKAVDGHRIDRFQGYFYGTCRDCKGDEDSTR